MKKILILIVLIFIGQWAGMYGQDTDTQLYSQAKILLFDREYGKALAVLDRLIANFPESSLFSRALFYRSRCLAETRMEEQAIKSYTAYLQESKNPSLREEAIIALIDLNYNLYLTGKEKFLNPIKAFLKSKQRTVRYYAAFKLSYISEKEKAKEAVPILKDIISKEADRELVDRAKLALMRINPDHVKKLSGPVKNIYSKTLYVSSFDKISKKETFAFNIPLALAKLALEALPDEEKTMIKKRGYHLDKILETLIKTGEIFRIESEDSIFKIWIK